MANCRRDVKQWDGIDNETKLLVWEERVHAHKPESRKEEKGETSDIIV